MIVTIIICCTVLIALVIILKWAKDMSTANLPMFTYGECVWKEATSDTPITTQPIGFAVADEEKQLSSQEQLEAVLQDTASTISALLRGEVDYDEIKQ